MSAINQRLSSWGLNSPAARRNITGYIFISPFILGVLIWFLIPAATAGWLTFQKWNLITAPRFVGLDNIENLFEDELFLQSLKVTTMYTLVAVPLGLVLSFFIALLLKHPRRYAASASIALSTISPASFRRWRAPSSGPSF